jgi:CSLREA domain-containing protein
MCFSAAASGGRGVHILTFSSLFLLLLGLLALPTSAIPNLSPSPANGHLYTVNTTADIWPDGCDPLPTGNCTLREAILVATSDGGPSNIVFNIPTSDTGYDPSTGVWTIRPVTDLPALDEPGTGIIGSSQTDNQGDTNPYGPEIVIDGGSLHECFEIESDNNTVNGLVINRCKYYGIRIVGSGAHHNTISGNYIGTNTQGTAPLANQDGGILVLQANHNTIGGATDYDRNVISGNEVAGVLIMGTGAAYNTVSRNYIGTGADGATSMPNGFYGVEIYDGAKYNAIGPNNVIAYNVSHGVRVDGATTTGNTITQNSIHSNGGEGIALTNGGNDDFTPPSLIDADCSTASGSLGSDFIIASTVEIFSDADGEGRFYEEGTFSWNTTFTFHPVSGRLRGRWVTATRTNSLTGSTSPFSEPIHCGCPEIFLPLILKNY